jgi:hypothetical protein
MKQLDLDKLEEVQFDIDKDAFSPNIMHCSTCNCKMNASEIEVTIDSNIYIKLNGFICPTCNKQYLGLEEAKKMDKIMTLSRAMKPGYKLTRKLSFDGDNYIFRVPKELTQNIKKKEIEIVPLGAKSFCAVVE